MNQETFNFHLSARLRLIEATLGSKGVEYSNTTDRLKNFRTGAMEQRTIPEDYLAGLVTKQKISVWDYIEELVVGKDIRSLYLWQEKLGDIINYMILLECLIIERKEKGKEDKANEDR
jgi:hypothetical protein